MASAAAGGGGGSKCYRSLLVTELALRLAAKIESQHPEPRLSYAVGYIFIATWHKSGAVLHGGRFAAGDACAKNSSSDACRCTDAKLVKKKEKVKYLYLIPSAVVSRWMNGAPMQILYCSLWDP